MPRRPLPGWVKSNDASVRDEAAPYKSMTPEERLRILDWVCRDALVLTRMRPDANRVFAYVDRLPENSQRILARLRSEARARRGRR